MCQPSRQIWKVSGMAKSALITFGTEESYGLLFVGGELLEHGQEIKFFDGEEVDWLDIIKWEPDFVMFSPMTTFFSKALKMAHRLKRSNSGIVTVFGGHHAMSDDKILHNRDIDVAVKGPVRGSIQRILDGERRLIVTSPTTPDDMPWPARKEYYRDIPRLAKRYRKFVISMLGCPWNCSYCSSSSGHRKGVFGVDKYKEYYMQRRPVSVVLDEIREIMTYGATEIEFEDDDVFAGDEEWLWEFLDRYDFSPTMYVSTCSVSALRASDRILKKLRTHVNVIGLGIQAIRPSTLKVYGRAWDNEKKMKAAYDRLVSYGFKVNMQAIVGAPIDDPVEDAIETVMGLQRIGPGSVCSVYPLMIYNGTKMQKLCKERDICYEDGGDTNTGNCDIVFDGETKRQLRNLCKLATFFVKYGMDEKLIRTMIKIDYSDYVSEELSMLRYRECVIDRLGKTGENIFNDILKGTRFKF